MTYQDWRDARENLIQSFAELRRLISLRDERIKHALKMIDLSLQSADSCQKIYLNLAKDLLK